MCTEEAGVSFAKLAVVSHCEVTGDSKTLAVVLVLASDLSRWIPTRSLSTGVFPSTTAMTTSAGPGRYRGSLTLIKGHIHHCPPAGTGRHDPSEKTRTRTQEH